MYWKLVLVMLAWAGVVFVIAGLVAAVGHRSKRALGYAKSVVVGAGSALVGGPLGTLFLWLSIKFFVRFGSVFKAKEEIVNGFTMRDRSATPGSILAFVVGLVLIGITAMCFYMGPWNALHALFTGHTIDLDKDKKSPRRDARKKTKLLQ